MEGEQLELPLEWEAEHDPTLQYINIRGAQFLYVSLVDKPLHPSWTVQLVDPEGRQS